MSIDYEPTDEMLIDAAEIDNSDEYHCETTTVSKTMLNEYCTSPVQYKLIYVDQTMRPKATTKPMLTGTVMHQLLLEKKNLDDLVAAYTPDCFKKNNTLNPKPANEFRQSIYPKLAVKIADLHVIYECFKAVVKSPLWDAIKQACALEKRHDATVYDLPCRCKPDILCDMGDHVLIYDLKFCPPNPGAFIRSAKMFRYWLQDAHYSAVVGHEFRKPVVFRFFAVEPTFPYRVQCYWYGQRQREIARDFHRNAVARLVESMATNVWEDRWPNELPLDHWDMGEQRETEPELEGFDDE